ncbi:MAG: hypothetical protein ACF8Q5_05800 [Phycisphaerales bacterium JB040]
MKHENPETAKIFLNLEDTPETHNAMSATGHDDGFAQDQPAVPQRPQQMNSTPSVASGPAIAALIVLIGGGSIFGMRVVSGQAAINADAFDTKVTDPVIGADFDQRFESTMAALEQSTRPVQVPIGYIPRDPFNFSDKENEGVKPVVTEEPVDLDKLRREREAALAAAREAQFKRERQTAMQKAVDGYQLQSTLQGPNAVARISGEIMRVGGRLTYEIQHEEAPTETSFFTVESIGGRTAVLVAEDGSRYELQIGLPTRELEPAPTEEPAPAQEAATPEAAPVAETGSESGETPEAEVGETPEAEGGETDAGESDEGAMSFLEKMAAAAAAAKAKAAQSETGTTETGTTEDTTATEAPKPEAESDSPAAEESADTEAEEGSADAGEPASEEPQTDEPETGETGSDETGSDEGGSDEGGSDEGGVSEEPASKEDGSETETETPVAGEGEGGEGR